MCDCRFCIFNSLFRRLVSKVVRIELGVHAYAADERSLTFFETDVCEQICRSDVFGRVVRGGCGTVGQSSRDAGGVDAAGFWEGGEGRLKREGVGVEPVEEGGFAKDADIGVLRGVDVGVCAFAILSVMNDLARLVSSNVSRQCIACSIQAGT